jgi:DNA-binding NarL/FixJ family response regulator
VARCSAVACGLGIPREGQVSGLVSSKASGDPARKPVGVFVLDDQEIVRRGVCSLLEAEPDIRSRLPGVACLMLTAFSDDQALLDAILAGAAGYVLKQVRGCDLADAVRTVACGQSLLHPRAASQLMTRLRPKAARSGPLAGLTPHERIVLELIGQGLTNRQIGERLFISEKTVKTYVSAMFRKLGLEQRTAAAAYAARTFGR